VVPFIVLGVLFVVGGLVGAFICGWACPFGFLQDLVGKIPTPKFTLPAWAGHFRYVVLIALVIAVPYFFGKDHPLYICRVCPAGALEAAVPNMFREAAADSPITTPNVLKLTILGLIVVGMLFKYRPWCTLFCPLGAIFGIFNRFSLFYLRYHPTRCTDCSLCHHQCKIGIRPDQRANDPRCIRCLDCTRCGAITVSTVFSEKPTEDPRQKPASQKPSDAP
jgi:polyferredoxin